MTSKLYVGNLPFATTAQELQDLFSQAGDVSAVELIFDKFTGRSRGFAFVNMVSTEDAKRVMDRFNGFDVGGRSLTVTEARPKEPRPRSFAGGGAGVVEERGYAGGGYGGGRRDDGDRGRERERDGGRRDHRGERNYRG